MLLALGLGVAAALVNPHVNPQPMPLQEVSEGDRWTPFIAPIELARRLFEHEAGLRIVDLGLEPGRDLESRSSAMRLPLAELIEQPKASDFRSSELVVLVADEPERARHVAQSLRQAGLDVRTLQGGAAAWVADVLAPVLSLEASPSERREFEQLATWSRYFGGQPRVLDAEAHEAASSESASQRVRGLQRRGCGF